MQHDPDDTMSHDPDDTMSHDPDDTMSHSQSFNLCTLSTVTCFKQLKQDVNSRELLPTPQ